MCVCKRKWTVSRVELQYVRKCMMKIPHHGLTICAPCAPWNDWTPSGIEFENSINTLSPLPNPTQSTTKANYTCYRLRSTVEFGRISSFQEGLSLPQSVTCFPKCIVQIIVDLNTASHERMQSSKTNVNERFWAVCINMITRHICNLICNHEHHPHHQQHHYYKHHHRMFTGLLYIQ